MCTGWFYLNLGGLRANVIEVKTFDELFEKKNEIEGKIVFFNRAMRADLVNTFEAYSEAVNQRLQGAEIAARFGAVGVIVRSLNLKLDDQPHTGNNELWKFTIVKRIPAHRLVQTGQNFSAQCCL